MKTVRCYMAVMAIVLCAACSRTQYVAVPTATSTVFWEREGAKDLVATSDTVVVHEREKGDTVRQTVYRARYVTKYRDRCDTVAYVERDTVAYAVPATADKGKKGRGWTWATTLAVLALLAAALYLYAMKR